MEINQIRKKNHCLVHMMGRYVLCPRTSQGSAEKEWVQGEMWGLIHPQSNERSKTGPVTLKNYLRLR